MFYVGMYQSWRGGVVQKLRSQCSRTKETRQSSSAPHSLLLRGQRTNESEERVGEAHRNERGKESNPIFFVGSTHAFVVSDDQRHQHPMLRIKIHFAEEFNLDPECTKIWWLIDLKDCAFISDLTYQLLHRLNLRKHAPHGLVLTMDDCTLLPNQSIAILRDNDTIR